MTQFISGIESMPSRKDGNCSRCSDYRLKEGKKPFKAKWRVFNSYTGGRINNDGSPAEPWTIEQYRSLWDEYGHLGDMAASVGTIYVKWAEMCGVCRNTRNNRELKWNDEGVKSEAI